jgi:hypothetical protein
MRRRVWGAAAPNRRGSGAGAPQNEAVGSPPRGGGLFGTNKILRYVELSGSLAGFVWGYKGASLGAEIVTSQAVV